MLDRQRDRRLFRRLGGPLLERLLGVEDATAGVPREGERTAGPLDTPAGTQDGHAPTADPEGPVQPGPAQQ